MKTNSASALNAQALSPMTPTKSWPAAHRELPATNTPASWLMDLNADGLEVHVSPDHALVLVDRHPIINGTDGAAHLRKGMHGLSGTRLSLVNEVEVINDSLMHGVYSGLLGGTAVLMDQYVRMADGVPQAIVRVLTRVNGSAPTGTVDREEFVRALLSKPVDAARSVDPGD